MYRLFDVCLSTDFSPVTLYIVTTPLIKHIIGAVSSVKLLKIHNILYDIIHTIQRRLTV